MAKVDSIRGKKRRKVKVVKPLKVLTKHGLKRYYYDIGDYYFATYEKVLVIYGTVLQNASGSMYPKSSFKTLDEVIKYDMI